MEKWEEFDRPTANKRAGLNGMHVGEDIKGVEMSQKMFIRRLLKMDASISSSSCRQSKAHKRKVRHVCKSILVHYSWIHNKFCYEIMI